MDALYVPDSLLQGSHIKIKTNTEIPVQVDGEPWLQPAGDIVVLKSALKVTFLESLNRNDCFTAFLFYLSFLCIRRSLIIKNPSLLRILSFFSNCTTTTKKAKVKL